MILLFFRWRCDGLAAYRKILDSIKKIGKKNLLVLFEIGFDQSTQVTDMMKEHGFKKFKYLMIIVIYPDVY